MAYTNQNNEKVLDKNNMKNIINICCSKISNKTKLCYNK